MAFSKPVEKKIIAKTEAKILGTAEMEWEIVGWNGPLSHEIRSRASFVAEVSLDDNPNSKLQLRFHLKPYQCHDELTQKFCTKKNQYVTRSSDCTCSTCSAVPLKTKAKIPLEFLPKTGTQSAGYSLLVDVLSPQENLMVSVSVEKLNGQKCISTNKVISVEPGSSRKNLVVERNFWRTLLWTVDRNGNIGNCTNTIPDTVDDARFHFSVTAHKLISTIADNSNGNQATVTKGDGPQLDRETVEDKIGVDKPKLKSAIGDDDNFIKMFYRDAKTLFGNKAVHTGDTDLAEQICELQELMKNLERKLITLCNEDNLDFLFYVADQYNLENLLDHIYKFSEESKKVQKRNNLPGISDRAFPMGFLQFAAPTYENCRIPREPILLTSAETSEDLRDHRLDIKSSDGDSDDSFECIPGTNKYANDVQKLEEDLKGLMTQLENFKKHE